MEGTVRLLLLTMLAIAVSAKYDFKIRRLRDIHGEIRQLDRAEKVDSKNMGDNVEVRWKAGRGEEDSEIVFDITEQPAFGDECSTGPAMTIDDGPDYCLFRVSFFSNEEDDDGNPILLLGLQFRLHNNAANRRLVLSEVFKPPLNEREDIWNTVRLQPFRRAQLDSARHGQSFSAPIAWVRKILDGGLYSGRILPVAVESEGDTDDMHEEVLRYVAYPVVIDRRVVNRIVNLKREL